MEIDIEKLKRMQMLHVAFILIDLRPIAQYEKGHLKGALNLPIGEFLRRLPRMVPKKDTPIVIYDEDGTSTADSVLGAEGLGYINIVNLIGGIKGSRP